MLVWNETIWFSICIGAALKSTAVLGVAWLAASLFHRRSAAARHLIWTVAAAAVLALPFLSISLPALRVPAAAVLLPGSTSVLDHATASGLPDPGASSSAAQSNAAGSVKTIASRPDWKKWLMLLWAAGVAAALARMLAGCAAMWRVRRSAKPFSDRGLCGALSKALGIRRPVDVLETERGGMPMTFGVLQPAIFMPADYAGWSQERRRVVLLHELAHVRRGDAATHLLARMALTFYWWNPLAWTAWREFLKERERAADDLVLNAGTRASEYASHLLAVARTMQGSPVMGWAAVAMARRSQLENRLLAILDSGINRKTPGRAWALVATLLAAGLVAPLAAVRGQGGQAEAIPADVDAAIRAAHAQKNHEILENAAKEAQKLRQYDTAQRLLESAVAIRGEVSGQQSVEYGVGLLKLADLERKRGTNTSAEAFYTKAAQVLGDRPEAARALMYLGTASLMKKDFPQAMDFFQHAQRVDPTQAGPASMWMAVVRQREQNMDEAEALYKSALSLEDPKSPGAITTMKVYAQFLRQQGRADEASELDTRAAAAQKANAAQVTARSGSGTVYRIGGDVSAPRVLQKVEPEYSDEARAALLAGTVVISVEIGTDGLAHNPQVLRELGLGLDEKALDAISQWRFEPATRGGQPVNVAATIEINFRLL